MSSIPPHSIDSDLDSGRLASLVTRFRRHDAMRMARTIARLPPRQATALEALPLLYHSNHPVLPGYVGADTPCGIVGYEPTRRQLGALRRVARSHQVARRAPSHTDIDAMFIMGSGGTLGHGRDSDIDLWVCCDTLLHSTLWPKVRMIDQWAAELGLELHTFLVDPEMLRTRGRLPGSRTPSLVLDEFYRSSALVAGSHPLWWLVAADDPQEYSAIAERLLRRRLVSARSVVDFGPVRAFAPDEVAHAAITELTRALHTPHKSLLKLKLLEWYGRSPAPQTVSAFYKARIHAGESDPLRLDPYLVLYDYLEQQLLAAGRQSEIGFVQRLLIGKTVENVDFRYPSEPPIGDPQTPLVERFSSWGFSRTDLDRFRDVEAWPLSERMIENEHIVTALEDGLRLADSLMASSTDTRPARPEEDALALNWLNETQMRALRFSVARLRPADASCIPALHPTLIRRRRTVTVELHQTEAGWMARDAGGEVLHCARLAGAVVWAEQNAVSLTPAWPDANLNRAIAQIRQGFRQGSKATRVFVNAEAPRRTGFSSALVKAGQPQWHQPTRLSQHGDPLDYGGLHQLHLETFDVVYLGAQGHWQLDTVLEGGDELLQRFARLLVTDPRTVSWEILGGQERFAMAQRVENLHQQAHDVLRSPGAIFVLPYGPDTVTLRQRSQGQGEIETRRHSSLGAMQNYVRALQPTTLGFDAASQRLQTLLHQHARRARPISSRSRRDPLRAG